jgi:glycine/D-amino acid oxidase-like deaminating enzyme
MEQYDFIVVGGGIVGAAVYYKLATAHPEAKIVLLEKESALASHQTGRNSGVIHSGLYYKPGSLKARTCLDGYRQMLDFAAEHGVKHDVCGKIVAAVGGIRAILGAMQGHPASAQVQEAACAALPNLTLNDDNEVKVAAEGGIRAILGAMQGPPASAQVQELACCALWNLALNDDNQVKVKSAGAEDAVKRAMVLKDVTAMTKEWGAKLLDRLKKV